MPRSASTFAIALMLAAGFAACTRSPRRATTVQEAPDGKGGKGKHGKNSDATDGGKAGNSGAEGEKPSASDDGNGLNNDNAGAAAKMLRIEAKGLDGEPVSFEWDGASMRGNTRFDVVEGQP